MQNSELLDEEKQKFESWRYHLKLPNHSYILLLGKIENTQTFVVLNSEVYPYTDTLKAVDACFKCLVSLQIFPVPSDFVWGFLVRQCKI